MIESIQEAIKTSRKKLLRKGGHNGDARRDAADNLATAAEMGRKKRRENGRGTAGVGDVYTYNVKKKKRKDRRTEFETRLPHKEQTRGVTKFKCWKSKGIWAPSARINRRMITRTIPWVGLRGEKDGFGGCRGRDFVLDGDRPPISKKDLRLCGADEGGEDRFSVL
eukprot:scaffold4510_cov183-Amphora_coffeaeformis.AAC.20